MVHVPVRAVITEYTALAETCGADSGFVNACLTGWRVICVLRKCNRNQLRPYFHCLEGVLWYMDTEL